MTPHVNRLDVRGKKWVFKTETQHENTRAKMITIKLIETEALEQVNTNFQEETLFKRSYPELIPLKKLQKTHSKVDIPKVPLAGQNCDRIHNINLIKTLAKVCSDRKRASKIESVMEERDGRSIEQGSHNFRKLRGSVYYF